MLSCLAANAGSAPEPEIVPGSGDYGAGGECCHFCTAANAGPRATPPTPTYGCPARASGVNPRLPCRATRNGRRGSCALGRHSPPARLACVASRGDEGALRGAVVVSGWLVRGDSWVESPPRAGTHSTTRLRPSAEAAAANPWTHSTTRLRPSAEVAAANPGTHSTTRLRHSVEVAAANPAITRSRPSISRARAARISGSFRSRFSAARRR